MTTMAEKKKGPKTAGIYDLLFKTLSNPTKASILMLLARKNRLTVTQMAKHIKVTRSNLYHFVGEMVEDGLLSRPLVVVKKNHIEKYYSQNPEFWSALTPFGQEERLKEGFTAEEGRALLQSMFLSLSLQYRIYSDEFANASDEQLEKIGGEFERERLMVSLWSVSDEEYDRIIPSLKEVLRKAARESAELGERIGKPEPNIINVICLPGIFESDED